MREQLSAPAPPSHPNYGSYAEYRMSWAGGGSPHRPARSIVRPLSWNIDGFAQKRRQTVWAQIDAVLDLRADVVCLQELRAESRDAWVAALSARYSSIHTTEHLLGERHNFLLIATDWDLKARPAKEFEVPFAELVASVVITLPGHGPVELTTTHVPNGSNNGWRKIDHLEGLYRYLSRTHDPAMPRILCGDFNCPRRELRNGSVITWAQNEQGTRLDRHRGQRWDAGERAVILGLKSFDLTDVYRDVVGYDAVEAEAGTWVARNRGREFPRPFDHVFASHHLRPWTFDYRHDLREVGLSDHSAALTTCGGSSMPN